jgi:type II secretory pathway component PulK
MGLGSLFADGQTQLRQQKLCLAYAAAALGFLALRWTLARLRHLLGRPHRTRPPAVSGSVPLDGRSGSVLVLTLVMLAVVGGLLVQIQLGARAARRRAEAALVGDRLRHAASVAARDAMRSLADGATPDETATNTFWNIGWDIQEPTGIALRVRVTDMNRYFDLNNLAVTSMVATLRPPGEVVMDLMTLCGHFTPVQKVEALADWIDPDSEGPWEADAYRDREPPYQPANRILYGLSELMAVDGFDRELFERHPYAAPGEAFKANLADCVAALPVPRSQAIPVNVNTAPPPVLRAVLGLDQDEAVAAIVGMRTIRRITSMDKVAPLLEPVVLQRSRPYLDVHSRFYRIDVRSFVEGQGLDLAALVYAGSTGEVEVLQWIL